jgi:hypothetical protein
VGTLGALGQQSAEQLAQQFASLFDFSHLMS